GPAAPDGPRPADVELEQRGRRDRAGVPGREAEAADSQNGAPKQKRNESSLRALRQAHADRREYGFEHPEALVDVSAPQELLRRAPTALEALRRGRPLGGLFVGAGRLEAAAGAGQGAPQVRPVVPPLGMRRRPKLDGPPIEPRGALEGERLRRGRGGDGAVLGGSLPIAGPAKV